ncbi:MAG: alpha/beta hydrolase [Ramlibacter sp.]
MPSNEPPFAFRPRHAASTVLDLRGGVRLAVDGVQAALRGLEATHQRLADLEPPVQRLRPGRPDRGWPALVYRSLHGTADLVGGGLDLVLASLQAWLQDPHRAPEPAGPRRGRDAAVAALNALVGDHLHRTDNPLAMRLDLRVEGVRLPHVLLLVHDLGVSDLQWRQGEHDLGAALAATLGCTAVYARYNTGRHVWATGRELAAELEQRLGSWPVPVQSLALLGHGLGGLVLRSALHQAVRSGMAWPALLRKAVFLGTPHAGAHPGRALDLLTSGGLGAKAPLVLARLAERRSDGVDDFLLGRWLEQDVAATPASPMPDPWPPGADAYAIAGSVGGGLDDGLVPVASALGRDLVSGQDLQLPDAHRWTATGVDHLGLLRSQAVFDTVRQWMAA